MTRTLQILAVALVAAIAACEPLPRASPNVDATSWSRVTGREGVSDLTGDVVHIGDAFLLGASSREGTNLWLSTDGEAWSDRGIETEGMGAGSVLVSLVGGRPGWIALLDEGPDEARRMGVRFSEDGRSWIVVGDDVFGGIEDVAAVDSVWSRDRFVIVGSRRIGEGRFEAVVISSRDGRTWTREHAPALQLSDWHSPAAITDWQGLPVILTDIGEDRQQAWIVSGPQAGDWTVSSVSASTDLTATTALGSPFGLLLGGCALGRDGVDAASIWVAWDGPGTKPLEVLSGADESCVYGLGQGPGEILAFGRADGRAAIWSSTDGKKWGKEPGPVGGFDKGPGLRALTGAEHGGTWVVAGQGEGTLLWVRSGSAPVP